jgi:hypothetical protein
MTRAPGEAYSPLDRFLHKLAFSGIEVQKSLADIEDRMHGARLGAIDVSRPVFIASLPRAGTTLLLELVTKSSVFVSHTYRSMPFVLCPILWDSISRGFHRTSSAKERAHGDGMSVGFDSPEAFEEVLWKAFWPQKYDGGISLWSAEDRNEEFEDFFRSHLKKLIVLSGGTGGIQPRYVSKNNANIARLPLLRCLFPDASILVPFRDPVDQAGSLLRQHTRFVEIHREDAFARWYMEAIGHYEFGEGLRPIRFPQMPPAIPATNPMRGDFWLAYWINAFSHVIGLSNQGIGFVDFDRMCADPLPAVEGIARTLQIEDAALLKAAAVALHPSVRYDPAELGFDPGLLAQARALYGELRARAIN